jgi:hypothetical protein
VLSAIYGKLTVSVPPKRKKKVISEYMEIIQENKERTSIDTCGCLPYEFLFHLTDWTTMLVFNELQSLGGKRRAARSSNLFRQSKNE